MGYVVREPARLNVDPRKLHQLGLRPGPWLRALKENNGVEQRALDALSDAIRGCTTLVCESQYAAADADLAMLNHHMTAPETASLAARAEVEQLIQIHVSRRYTAAERNDILLQAQEIFPRTSFAPHWPHWPTS